MVRVTANSLLQGAANSKSMHEFLKPSVLSQGNNVNEQTSTAQGTPKRKATSPAGLHDLNENASSLKDICRGINSINEKLSSMQISIDSNNALISQTASKSYLNEMKIDKISAKTNFLHQSQLNDKMEISGITSTTFDDKLDMRTQAIHFLNELSIKVEPYEIANAYQRKKNVRGTPTPIAVIVFVHEAIKSRIMRCKMSIKSGAATKYYFNDVLTPQNRAMVYKAKELMRAGKFSNVGTLNGQVYVKKAADGEKIFIDSFVNMEEIAKMSVSDLTAKIVSSRE